MWLFIGFILFFIVAVVIEIAYHSYACKGKCTCYEKGDPFDYVDR